MFDTISVYDKHLESCQQKSQDNRNYLYTTTNGDKLPPAVGYEVVATTSARQH